MLKKTIAVFLLVLAIMAIWATSAFALSYEEVMAHVHPGKDGFTSGEDYLASIGKTWMDVDGYASQLSNYSVRQEDGVTYYIFEGKEYVADYSWGNHYLTGYTAAPGGSKTRSGNITKAWHTISGPKAMLGNVALVKSVSGPMAGVYDGVYVFEDTGGPAVETGLERTMGVPVVDIYRPTQEETEAVSGKGWTTAEVIILKRVK